MPGRRILGARCVVAAARGKLERGDRGRRVRGSCGPSTYEMLLKQTTLVGIENGSISLAFRMSYDTEVG